MTRRMNRYEISQAWERYERHPVLGPAVRTLGNLANMADSTSDGWGVWQAPAQAAGKLVELIERDGTARYRFDAERADAAEAEYRRALTPLKAFRTRAVREHGQGSWFEIIEPGEGVGGEVWAARQAYEDACRLHDQASLREQAARELMRRAGAALREAQQCDDALGVLAELTARRDAAEGQERAKLVALATPGTALWLLPSFRVNGADGYDGLGERAVSLGLTVPDGLVVICSAGHDEPHSWLRLNPSVVLTVAEALERWWIVDAEGANLVSGGHRDHERMLRLRDDKYAGCQVQQGREFIPEKVSL